MKTARQNYDGVAIALHWLIGAALLAQIVFGFFLDDIAARGTPQRAGVINLHKSVGIVLGLAIVARLGWRLLHKPPRLPDSIAQWQRSAARVSHRALYVCMIVMPLSGYVGSNFSKYGVKFFGIDLPPWAPESKAFYSLLGAIHYATAVLLCALIAVHVIAALKHLLVDRDNVVSRMWPRAGSHHFF
jgi:cytochrome b561